MFNKEDIIKYHFPEWSRSNEEDLVEHKRINLIATIIKDFCEANSSGPFGDFDIFSRAYMIMKMVFGYKRLPCNETTIYVTILHLLLVKHMVGCTDISFVVLEAFMGKTSLAAGYNMANNAPNIIGVFHTPRRAMSFEAIENLSGKFLGGYCLVTTGTYQEKVSQINHLIDILFQYLLEDHPDLLEFGLNNPHLFTFEKFFSLYNKQ